MTLHMDIHYTEIRLIISFAAEDRELYTVSKNKTCNWLDQFLITKFRIKLNKVGKITRPFRYDPNKIPYDYTVEVTNRFKGLHLLECLKNYGWRFWTPYRRQWQKLSQRKRNARQSGCLRKLYKAEERREVKGKGERERHIQLNAEFQRILRRDKVKVKLLSRVRLFVTPWNVAYQAPQPMWFSKQEYWSGLLFPSPGDLSDPGIEPGSPAL